MTHPVVRMSDLLTKWDVPFSFKLREGNPLHDVLRAIFSTLNFLYWTQYFQQEGIKLTPTLAFLRLKQTVAYFRNVLNGQRECEQRECDHLYFLHGRRWILHVPRLQQLCVGDCRRLPILSWVHRWHSNMVSHDVWFYVFLLPNS